MTQRYDRLLEVLEPIAKFAVVNHRRSLGGPTLEDSALSVIALVDDHGRTLPCRVQRAIEVHGQRYLLLTSAAPVLAFVEWAFDGSRSVPHIVEEPNALARLFEPAAATLKRRNLTLVDSAFVATLQGEPPPVEERGPIITVASSGADGSSAEESLQLVDSFFLADGEEIAICLYMSPTYLWAQEAQKGTAKMLARADFELARNELEALDD